MLYYHITASAPLYTNTFLIITKNNKAAIIDPAANIQEYETLMNAKNAKLTHILLTHGHYDHVTSAKELSEKYSAPIYLGEGDCSENRLFPLSAKDGIPYTDGEIIEIDEDFKLKVIATPGHSRGGVCLVCEEDSIMFSGDTLFANDIGRCDLEGSSFAVMLQSLKKLNKMVKDDVKVMPGHGEFSNFGFEKNNNEYFKQ